MKDGHGELLCVYSEVPCGAHYPKSRRLWQRPRKDFIICLAVGRSLVTNNAVPATRRNVIDVRIYYDRESGRVAHVHQLVSGMDDQLSVDRMS